MRGRAKPDWLNVWIAAGSGALVMVALALLLTARSPALMLGDIAAHASYAEWLRTLPWWDWRGWSDWFYGGHPVGVNYPPLIHALGRFTHPVWSQVVLTSAAVLGLLPWGLLRLARAVGLDRGAQLAAMASALVLAPASVFVGEAVHGLHFSGSYFGLGPSMVCVCLGVFAASHAARCCRPVTAGVLLGSGVLFNVSPIPGVLMLVVSLLASSGADWKQAFRWLATAGTASLAVSAWWVVPFLAGRERLVNWKVSLPEHFDYLHPVPVVLLTAMLVVAVQSARRGPAGVRRLVTASAWCGLTVLVIDLLGYQYSERSLMPAFLAALTGAAWALAALCARNRPKPVRHSTTLLAAAASVCAAVITQRVEFLPAAVWLSRGAPRTLRALSAVVAVTALLLSVPVVGILRHDPDLSQAPEAQAIAATGDESGFVMFNMLEHSGAPRCDAVFLSRPTVQTDGRVRHLIGGQVETSSSAEFVRHYHRDITTQGRGSRRPHWAEALRAKGDHQVDPARTAELLGARWLAQCDPDVSLVDLPATRVTGERVTLLGSGDAWHQAAVSWWIDATARGAPAEVGAVPALGADEVARSHPGGAAARGVTVEEAQDRLTVTAASAGWAWVRVPWDPWWRSSTGEPVLKGGPGHLVVWARQGATELVWDVPAAVDAAAAAATAAAAAAAAALAALNRRRGFRLRADRPTPAADTARAFHDTIDQWASTARTRISTLRRPSYPRGP